MPIPSTDCYCGMDKLDVLKLIFESDQAIFDRLSQVITAASSGGTDIQAGSQVLINGSDTVSVVFGTPFASVPVVVANASRPVAQSLIDVNIDEASITVNGFTASLGAAPASGDYRLKWMAHEVT